MKNYFSLMGLRAYKVKNSSVNCRVNQIYAAALCVQTPNGEESM